ncbi:MAG: PAS domain-containing protein [Alphaproteobacteria bacterium]|nr:PAS domain-containing protein [Alphaproteobacteria bacterium]
MATIPPSHLHPKLQELYTYWRAKSGTRAMPALLEINLATLKSWLANLVIIGVREENKFHYHYCGASFIDAFGVNMSGRTIDSLPEAQRALIQHEYDYVRTRKTPTCRIYSGEFDGRILTWERLILPVSSDGATVDAMLVGVYERENEGMFEVEGTKAG